MFVNFCRLPYDTFSRPSAINTVYRALTLHYNANDSNLNLSEQRGGILCWHQNNWWRLFDGNFVSIPFFLWVCAESSEHSVWRHNNNNINNRGQEGIAFPSLPPLERLWLLFLVTLGRAGLGAGELRCSGIYRLPLCVLLYPDWFTDESWRA